MTTCYQIIYVSTYRIATTRSSTPPAPWPGTARAQAALAWLRGKPVVTAPLLSASIISHAGIPRDLSNRHEPLDSQNRPRFWSVKCQSSLISTCSAPQPGWTAARRRRVQNHRYRSSLLGWATARDWIYRDGGEPVTEFLREAEWTSLLPKGDRRWGVKLQLEGTRQGRPVTVSHYWYQTTRTDSDGSRRRSTRHMTVVVVG
jgi:hypothetical protein